MIDLGRVFAKEFALSVTCLFLSLSPLALPKLLLPIVWSLLVGALPVVVKTSDGKQIEGNLDGFTADSLRLNRGGQITELPFDDLLSMYPPEVESRTGPSLRVTLAGGSKIAVQSLSSTDNDLVIEPRRQSPLSVPFKQVKSIRFRAASTNTDPQWLGIVEREQRGDTLVIRRAGDRLDPQQGLVTGVTTDMVQFDLDGTMINAPADRLEGVVFGGTTTTTQSDVNIQVTDIFGSVWAVVAIEPGQGDQPLRMKLSDSLSHELPLDQIELIRWSGGIRMLAEEKPAGETYQPFLANSIDTKLQKRSLDPWSKENPICGCTVARRSSFVLNRVTRPLPVRYAVTTRWPRRVRRRFESRSMETSRGNRRSWTLNCEVSSCHSKELAAWRLRWTVTETGISVIRFASLDHGY